MVTIMTEWLKGDLPFKIDIKQVDLFIEERQKVIQSFFQVFDNQHTAVLTAIAIHQAPYQSFKSELELSFKPATLKEPLKGSQHQEVDAEGKKMATSQGPISLADWFENCKHQEATVAQGDD